MIRIGYRFVKIHPDGRLEAVGPVHNEYDEALYSQPEGPKEQTFVLLGVYGHSGGPAKDAEELS